MSVILLDCTLDLFRIYNTLSESQKLAVYKILHAPLGILDPYSDEQNLFELSSDQLAIDKLINLQYGANGAYLDFASEDATKLIDEFFKDANNFDETAYYAREGAALTLLNNRVAALTELQILASWSDRFKRVNNVFIDTEQDTAWSFATTDYIFWNFGAVNEVLYSTDTSLFDPIIEEMHRLGIQAVYKCNGNKIYILDGLVDNAYGLVFGTSGAEALNCGFLRHRFNVVSTTELNEEVIFFIAN